MSIFFLNFEGEIGKEMYIVSRGKLRRHSEKYLSLRERTYGFDLLSQIIAHHTALFYKDNEESNVFLKYNKDTREEIDK